MDKSERLHFIKLTEKLVTPKKVATVFQGAEFLRKLPHFLQKKIMEKGAKSDPYISFIVEPYSLFLAYEILDEDIIAGMLPVDYELTNCSMFENSPERKCVIIGAFNVHTSVFWGNRVEMYIIARNRKTGLVSWIIQEYETNTISYDPGRGFVMPDTKHSILTTSFLGEVILDMVGKNSKNKIQVNASAKKGLWKKLSQKLWVEGNLSVDYSSQLTDARTKPFGLIFDPAEMDEALLISKEDYEVIDNTFLDGIIDKAPFEVCCFPFAQHFYTTTIPMGHSIKNKDDLEKRIVDINKMSNTDSPSAEKSNNEKPCPGYCFSYSCKNRCHLRDKTQEKKK